MAEEFLGQVYQRASKDDKVTLFDNWAETYDAEVGQNGYVTPSRVAAALAKHIPTNTPVLDFGCGTGLSGEALKAAGFTTIDGMEPSAPMREGAIAKGIYRQLLDMDVHDDTPVAQDSYAAITAIGVIGVGAAPADTLHILMKALPKGGHLAFSFNDRALAEPEHEAALCQWLDCGAASLLFKEYGPHLPGKNMKSNVYIVEKN